MTKNVKLNKQILKALSLGISTSMMLHPVNAFAAESDDNNTTVLPNTEEHETVETKADAEAAGAEAAAIEQENITPAVEKLNETVEAAEELGVDATGLKTELDSDNNGTIDAAEQIGEIKSDLEAIGDKEILIESEISTVKEDIGKANAAIEAAKAIVAETEETIKAASEAVETADGTVDEERDNIASATTGDEARNAYDRAETAVNEANDAVDIAIGTYAKAEADFSDAKDAYNAAAEKYQAAFQALVKASAEYDEMKSDAASDTRALEEELSRLATEAETLKNAAESAKDEYNAEGYAYIAALEAQVKATAKEKNVDWASGYDKLFNAIVEFYYIPEVEGGEFVSAKWTKSSGSYTYEDGTASTLADVLNYCTVTYKDANGDTQTKLLNYKTSTANGQRADGIVIFEKTEHTVVAGKDLSDEVIEQLDGGDVVESKDLLLVKDEDGTYVGFDAQASQTVESNEITEGTVEEEGKTTVVETDGEKTEWIYSNEDSTLTKKVTTGVTTTVYTGATLDGQSAVLASEDEARTQYKAELQTKIDALAEGDVLVIGEGETAVTFTNGDEATDAGFVSTSESKEVTTGYTVSGTYQEKFSKTVEISGTAKNENKAESEYEKKVADEAATYKYVDKDRLIGGEHQQKYTFVDETHTDATITQNGKNYDYSGSVTVSYQELKSQNLKDYYALWEGIKDFFTGRDSEEEMKKELQKQFEAEGKTIVAFDGWDGGFGTGKIYYVDSKTASQETAAATEEEARETFADSVETAEGAEACNVNISSVQEIKSNITQYGYNELNYTVKTTVFQTVTLLEEVWSDVEGKSATELRNDNWYSGDVLLAEYSKEDGTDYRTDGKAGQKDVVLSEEDEKTTAGFRAKVDTASATIADYEALIKKAEESQKAVEAAEKRVADLRNQIAELGSNATVDKLIEFGVSLNDAKDALDAAIKARDELNEKLAEVRGELETRIAVLTPAPAAEPAAPVADVTVITEGETALAAAPVIVQVVAPQAEAPAPAAEVEETQDTEDTSAEVTETAEAETSSIEDEDVARAAAPEATAAIEDEEAPLAAAPEAQKMSWWWLLIVLILGTTGTEMYRRHMAKKNAAKVDNTTETK
ncbi:MAG: hypothetical protein K6E32_04315 [Lachnospiraceae bacterium]|nr:hypothetical protein [Lachnospiraceae bacterium]